MTSASLQQLPVLVNPVLSYGYVRLKQASCEEVCDSLFSMFEEWEFGKAKDALWEHIAKGRSDDLRIIGEKQKRKGSSTRSAAMAHCQDLLKALQELDDRGALPPLAVEVEDLMELPPITPQLIALKRQATMDKHLSMVEEELHQSHDAVKETLASIQEAQRKMAEELVQLHQRLDGPTQEPISSTPVSHKAVVPVPPPVLLNIRSKLQYAHLMLLDAGMLF